MKHIATLLLLSLVTVLLAQPVYAQVVPTPSPAQASVETNPSESATSTITYLINFISGVDKFVAGGLVFTTPDVFASTITLPDGASLNGFAQYRDAFTIVAIGIFTIILAVIGTTTALDQADFLLQPFLFRLILTGALFVAIPFIFSLSIQGTNLLNNQILLLGKESATTIDFGGLITNIFTDMGKQISGGVDPSTFGIPNVQFSILGDIMKSVGLLMFETFVFLVTILFFLLGFLFILFQFVIRFVSLLFLSIMYPFVVPFAISQKTQGIVKAYFMAWIGFLIHQPAFILGYMIVLSIFNSLLTAKGASLGMLFLYAGSLFFLAGINSLVTKIFGEPWTAIGTNIQAAVATAEFVTPANRFTQGAIGGNAGSFSGLIGRSVARKAEWLSHDGRDFSFAGIKKIDPTGEAGTSANPSQPQSQSATQGSSQKPTSRKRNVPTEVFIPSFTQEIQKRGVDAQFLNKKEGTVTIKNAQGYAYTNPKTGLIQNYFSKEDALTAGHKPEDLQKTTITGNYVDYSTFSKKSGQGIKSPHNSYISKQAKETGFKGKTHLNLVADEERIKNHLTVGKDYFKEKDIQGVVGLRYGNANGTKSKKQTLVVYTKQ